MVIALRRCDGLAPQDEAETSGMTTVFYFFQRFEADRGPRSGNIGTIGLSISN